MSVSAVAPSPESRLRTLLDFLSHDPGNLSLLAEAASTALDAGDLTAASDLIDRYEALQPLPPTLLGLRGVVLLSGGRFAEAVTIFEALLAVSPGDPAIAFNLAWARSMVGDHAGALAVLDPAVAGGLPRAASLKIQALHHLGLVDEALAEGEALVAARPGDRELAAALALVATDAERTDLARLYGDLAGPHPDGLATLGALALNDNQVGAALAYYDQALATRADNARALLGKGLCLLIGGQTPAAADHLTRAATVWGDHTGTWIAVGWAHYVGGDLAASRQAFERALAIDDTFAESHGGLAVLDVAEGQIDSARRRATVALRLDRQCFAAALATSLIAEQAGDASKAARIRQVALNVPLDDSGRTIATSLAAMDLSGLKGGRRR